MWHGKGSHAALFDNASDSIDFSSRIKSMHPEKKVSLRYLQKMGYLNQKLIYRG